ncbi:HNH endonuclease [Halobacteriaceae archaeon GCM10025711]
MIDEDTYSKGDQKIFILSDGVYDGPLSKYVDDWDAIFEYAVGDSSPEPTTNSNSRDSGIGQYREPTDEVPLPEDTAGAIREGQQTQVQVSEAFKRAVYDRFDHQCVLTGVENSNLLTVSHVLGRASHPEIAEDIENVLLLDWTHHAAFDAGLWTFDESGRIWVKPNFNTESECLRSSLVDRHGEKVVALAGVKEEYIERRNDELDWWPPR